MERVKREKSLSDANVTTLPNEGEKKKCQKETLILEGEGQYELSLGKEVEAPYHIENRFGKPGWLAFGIKGGRELLCETWKGTKECAYAERIWW